jgi:hypothetical protein
MSSYPTRMNMMGILPKFGTGYLTFKKKLYTDEKTNCVKNYPT